MLEGLCRSSDSWAAKHLGSSLGLTSSLHALLQVGIQSILLLHQPLQLTNLPLYDCHFLLQSL